MINKLDKALHLISATCLALVFIIILLQVVMRYVFQFVPFFIEESARYLCIWGVLAGMTASILHRTHIRVDLLQQMLHGKINKSLSLFLELVSLCLYLTFAVLGYKLTLFLHIEKSIGLGLPLSIPAAAIPFFFTLAVVASLVNICQLWKN